jgi:hypothetical protein
VYRKLRAGDEVGEGGEGGGNKYVQRKYSVCLQISSKKHVQKFRHTRNMLVILVVANVKRI